MKRFAITAALLLALTLALCGCTGYSGETAMIDGVTYYISDSGDKAFASAYDWDLDPENTDIYIADTVKGARVETLGGFIGTGVPCPLDIRPAGDCVCDNHPDETVYYVPVTWRDLAFTVHVGSNLTGAKYIASSGCYGIKNADGSIDFYRPVYYFDCDPDNPVMYSRDGMLYFRKDGAPVIAPKDLPEPKESGSREASPVSGGDMPDSAALGAPLR